MGRWNRLAGERRLVDRLRLSANCPTVPDVRIFGCGLARAESVQPFLAPYTRRRWHKLLALQFPWSWLFQTRRFGPIGSTAGIQAALHLLMAQVAGDDRIVEPPQLYRELPEYVIAAQEGIEFTEPAPAKRLLITDIGQVRDLGRPGQSPSCSTRVLPRGRQPLALDLASAAQPPDVFYPRGSRPWPLVRRMRRQR